MSDMRTAPRVVVIPGDGIGPEVMPEAIATMEHLGLGFRFEVLDKINATTYAETGVAMSEDDFATCARDGLVLLGAVGDPRVRDPRYARDVLLRLRFELDLYVNYRPVRLLHDRLSPLRDPARRAIDCAIVRENTEGLYAGIGGVLRRDADGEVAIDTEVNTRFGVSRIIDFALSVATRAVCMVDKSNAVPSGGGLWQRCWAEARTRRPDLATSHLYVDAAAMALVRDPTAVEVIVTNNSYGDILSDLAAELAGGLGTAASANLNPVTGHGLYEPVHGSAPDIAGTGVANPIGAIASAALLLRQCGFEDAARAVDRAIRAAVARDRCTPDLGGRLSTAEAGAAIRAEL